MNEITRRSLPSTLRRGSVQGYSFLTSRNFTNAYTYDAASNRTGFTDPESGSTAYSYDNLNRLTSLAPPSAFGSGSFGFSYDALSRRTQMTRPNNVTTNYAYDNLSRLTSVLHQLSGSTIDGASYTLDSAGNRTAKTDLLASSTSNYTYDPIYQLTQVTEANNTRESYSYDAVGNRTASLGVSSYTTNASNELTATSNATYTYDSNGNMLTKTVGADTTSYAWDFENRLASVSLPASGGTVTFKYDPLGRRVYKSSSGGTSNFAYDGADLIEETNASGTVVARYTQTEDIDEPIAMLRSSATSYFEADGLDSVTSLSNGAGSLAQTYTFDSFGKQTGSSGSLDNPFRYTGRESDSETGLYYYRARYYDPSSGRFVGEDPLQFGGNDTNFYNYVGGGVINYTDPSGLDRVCPFPWLCPDEGPIQPPKWLPIHSLPPGSILFTSPGGQTFWVPPGTDWCQECADAQKNGRSLSAADSSVGQGGKYDYQRDQTNHTVNSNFQEAANYSVGVYMQCAGFTRTQTMGIGKLYGLFKSLNFFNSTQRTQWTNWWGAGWDAASSGAYSKSTCPTCR